MKLRIGLAQFNPYNPLDDIDKLAAWGFDYAEPALAPIAALSDVDFASALQRAKASRIRVEATNMFLPAALKVAGPSVNQEEVRGYLRKALARAEALGVKVVVFGSGGARSFPEGFPKERAWLQVRDFLRECGDAIARNNFGMLIAIEELRKAESNILNTVAESLAMARAVDHPKVQLLADFFHIATENEDSSILLKAGKAIVHVHIANPNNRRVFPKEPSEDSRYGPFFENLRAIGYSGRISVEANTTVEAFESDARGSLAFLRSVTERRQE